jgi:lipopolysaccharide biosynthesis protein
VRIIDRRDARVARRAQRAAARRPTGRDTAVLVHLYYPEVWPVLAAYVSRLRPGRADVFVTIPKQNRRAVALVRKTFPEARCLVVPNRGRDVLPFLIVADRLRRAGYEIVLKIHSKKSEHFGGGDQWRDQMLEELLPEDPAVLDEILDTLARPATGMVGPHSSYFPLNTYWAGNAPTVRRLLAPVVSGEALARLQNPRELGFFAGTMFWTRLDALEPLLGVGVRDFVCEPTPKDGTMSHALERAMPVLPELSGRHQFDSDGTRVAPRPALADVLPDWYRSATKAAIAAAERDNGRG